MDASKITELLQKQNNVYINRSKTVDSSTLTWQNQILSSTYIKGVATCTGEKNTNVPTQSVCSNSDGTCSYGNGKQMTIATDSTQQYPSVFGGAAGSAAEVYSSERILLQQAGMQTCSGSLTQQTNGSYVIIPVCSTFTTNTNGPTDQNPTPSINQNTNPYLPQFDTYYRFKNQLCTAPVRDANQKNFVNVCDTCVMTPNNTV